MSLTAAPKSFHHLKQRQVCSPAGLPDSNNIPSSMKNLGSSDASIAGKSLQEMLNVCCKNTAYDPHKQNLKVKTNFVENN